MKKSQSKILKEIDGAKKNLNEAKKLQNLGKSDKAVKAYDSAIKILSNILKTNDEQSIKDQLINAYIEKGDLLKSSGLSKDATHCYEEAAKLGSDDAHNRLRESGLFPNPGPATPPPLPTVSPRPALPPKPTKSPRVSSAHSSSNASLTSSAPVTTTTSQSPAGSLTSSTPSVAISPLVKKAPPKTPAAVKQSTSNASAQLNTNCIFKKNPAPLKVDFKLKPGGKIESTAQLNWLISREAKKESEQYHQWINLAMGVISLFAKEPVKQRPEIEEVIALAGIDNEDFSTDLLEVLITPIKNGTLLKPSMLNGLAEVINHIKPTLLDADDFVQILRILKHKLESTHSQGSAKKLEHLMRSVARLMTAMVDAGIKGLARKEDHQPLYDCLQKFSTHSNRRIAFETQLALQALARLPDDESNLGSLLRRTFHVVRGVAHLGDAVLSMSAINLLDSYHSFYKAVKIQTNFKREWYEDLRYAQFLIKWNHFDAFELFLKDINVIRNENFYMGVIYALKEVVDTHYDEETQYSALEYISTLFSDKNLLEFENARIEIINSLVDIVRQGDPKLAEEARKVLVNLSSNAKGKDADFFKLHLPDLNSIKSKSQKMVKPVRNALITSTQNPTNSNITDQLQEMRSLLVSGFEMDLPKSIEKKCELLRQRALSDQDTKEELLRYIPVRGAYRITDESTFDMEAKAREFIKSDKRKLLLIGNAGGGKSTFNKFMHVKLWEGYQTGGIIPIFVSLPTLMDPIKNLMNEVLSECGFTTKEIDFLRENRELCLILDGYDEVDLTTNLYVSNKLAEWDKISIILSCRTQYIEARKNNYLTLFLPTKGDKVQTNLFQEVTVVPFSDAQIEAYITKYIELHDDAPWKSAEEWVVHIKSIPGLRELIETPFLLMLTMDVLPELVKRYENLTGAERVKMLQASLYEEFVENWFRREEYKLVARGELPNDGYDIKQDFWEFGMELASEMHKRQQFQVNYTPTRSLFGEKKGKSNKSPWAKFFSNEPAIAAARKACLLRRVGTQQWAFMHKTICEHFFTRKIEIEEMVSEDNSSENSATM